MTTWPQPAVVELAEDAGAGGAGRLEDDLAVDDAEAVLQVAGLEGDIRRLAVYLGVDRAFIALPSLLSPLPSLLSPLLHAAHTAPMRQNVSQPRSNETRSQPPQSKHEATQVLIVCAYREPSSGGAVLDAAKPLIRPGDKVVIVHVLEATDLPWSVDRSDFDTEVERGTASRKRFIEQQAQSHGIEAEVVVDVETPEVNAAAIITREAEARDANLVVLVSKRATGLRGALLGSVARGVLQHCHCPVTIVHPPDRYTSDTDDS